MLIRKLKQIEAPHPCWQFVLDLQCGKSVVSVGGWRYYEDSQKVVPPKRRDGEQFRQMAWLGDGAQAEIAAAVQLAISGKLDFDPAVLDAALATIASAPDPGPALEQLAVLPGIMPQVILYCWRRYGS